ncbi:MAG: hypothetical protein ACKVVP_13365 [Chloroflexota bacterium]
MIDTERDTPALAEYDKVVDSGDWRYSPTMHEQISTPTPAAADTEVPPRWALERAELQGDVDALVHQVLAGLLNSAEELKQRIREDTTAELRESRRERDAIRAEIESARHELEAVRTGNQAAVQEELDRERESILAAARAEADQIIQNAQTERETLLGEIRATESRLRGLQEQIQSLLGFSSGISAAPAAPPPPAPAAPLAPPAPAPAVGIAAPSVVPSAPHVAPPAPVELTAPVSVYSPVSVLETPIAPDVPAPPTNFSGLIDSSAETAVLEPLSVSEPVAPAPVAPAGPRTLELVFTNVPGYQQAAAIERATRQLPDVSGVDVQEFERGRLVLEVQASNPIGLASLMVASAPAAMSVADETADRITFQLA